MMASLNLTALRFNIDLFLINYLLKFYFDYVNVSVHEKYLLQRLCLFHFCQICKPREKYGHYPIYCNLN